MLKITFFLLITLVSIVLAGVYPNFRIDYEFKPVNITTNNNNNSYNSNNDWWKTANFYQIYPRSFQDSDGDGVGDLNGITSRLQYLKEIGVTATWLSPIFTSPMADFGYDIANFREIDKIFGTMDDFDKLIKRADELNIKIILDFVPNHSSDECEWFKKSVINDPQYKDFYVWHPGRPNPNPKERNLPPSNWISVFRGSAWTWNEERKEYYLHQFVSKQPDLNYRNPKVHEEMADVLRFWLKKGVAGFRIDAVPHVYEIAPDAQGNYKDEPTNPEVNDLEDYGSLIHTFTVDQDETLDLVYEWRKIMDDFQNEYKTDTKVLLAETYSPLDTVMKYYGNGKVKGAHIPFNFLMISSINNESNAQDYANIINKWQEKMIDGRTANWVVGNHDKNRVGSRLGSDNIDIMNMIIMTLPGIAVTYQGEEIGMTDVWISWKDTVDPSACNSNANIYEKFSRDPERTPFQWNDLKNAGFSNGPKTWLPIANNYEQVNVKIQRAMPKSHLNIYKQLRALRNEQVFQDINTKTTIKPYSQNILLIKRELNNDVYIILANLNHNVEKVNLKDEFKGKTDLVYVITTDRSSHRIGDIVPMDNILLLPKEAAVFRTKNTKVSLSMDDYYSYKVNV